MIADSLPRKKNWKVIEKITIKCFFFFSSLKYNEVGKEPSLLCTV